MRVGLLGGSFDPPHIGHVFISDIAKRKFRLHKIVWLVACQNPLKKQSSNIENRINGAKKFVSNNKDIIVSKMEKYYKISRSYIIIKRFINSNKNSEVFLILGSDCMEHFHKWHLYAKIHKLLKIIVIERHGLLYKNSKFWHRFKGQHLHKLVEFQNSKYGWFFMRAKTPNISSTEIKNKILS